MIVQGKVLVVDRWLIEVVVKIVPAFIVWRISLLPIPPISFVHCNAAFDNKDLWSIVNIFTPHAGLIEKKLYNRLTTCHNQNPIAIQEIESTDSTIF